MQKKSASYYLYISGIIIMLLGLPTSRFFMSISQFIMLGAWVIYGVEMVIAEGQKPGIKWPVAVFKKLFSILSRQKAALVFLGIISLHFVGLFWTEDIAYGIRDLRIKLPLLLLPVIFSTMPALTKKQLRNVLFVYLFALFAASVESMYILFTKEITDIREISDHISHVRLALNVVLGIFVAIYLALSGKNGLKVWQRALSFVLFIWFILFLFIMKSPTGLIILILTSGLLFLIFVFHLKSRLVRIITPIFFLFAIIAGVVYLHEIITQYTSTEEIDIAKLETHTAHGGLYEHDTIHFPGIENGQYTGLYICQEELRTAWEKRSMIPYDGADKMNQELKVTLIRYLNSKGLRKDARGIDALTDSDIHAIEGGVANYYYISKFSIRGRVYQVLFGFDLYNKTGNPNGNSTLQRREYWKAGWNILKTHPVLGVGTGDLRLNFREYYEATNSRLLPEYRHRAHNQYLSIAIAFGVIGLIIFLIGLLYPPYILRRHRSWYFTVLIIIVILSFIAEDTLETQAGATFSAFFYCLFLWGTLSPKGKKLKPVADENI